jgi:multiple sugar transport system substrate-binding protein
MHPTRRLIEEFESYAIQMKTLVGSTFGFNDRRRGTGRFLFRRLLHGLAHPGLPQLDAPGHRLRPTVPDPRVARSDIPHARAVRPGRSRSCAAVRSRSTTLPLDGLLAEIMEDAKRPASRYDLVAVDLPWIGQLAEAGVIAPLDDVMLGARYNTSDFHGAACRGAGGPGVHTACRSSRRSSCCSAARTCSSEAGLDIPQTTEDVLRAARVLDRASLNVRASS